MELFQYYDEDGTRKRIDSGMVNSYIKNIVGQDFTAKDIRTWSGTVYALEAFREILSTINTQNHKKTIVDVIDKVANHLGNTRSVCKKYYIHPTIFDLYEKDELQKYLAKISTKNNLRKDSENKRKAGLNRQEKVLMSILKKNV